MEKYTKKEVADALWVSEYLLQRAFDSSGKELPIVAPDIDNLSAVYSDETINYLKQNHYKKLKLK